MAGSRRRRQLQRQRQLEATATAPRDLPPKPSLSAKDRPSATSIADLPPELLAQIQRRIRLVDRLNLALAGYGGGGVSSWQEAPCLILPTGESAETAKFISLLAVAGGGGCQVVTARAPDPAMRGHVVLGSSGGWLVTADLQGVLRMANPVTGEQADLPAISTGTIPFHEASHGHVVLDMNALTLAAGGSGTSSRPPFTIANWQMRKWFYRKAVLSSFPRPGSSYAAMLILERHFGAAAFATAGDHAWRLAHRRPSADSDGDGIEDAIFHGRRFHSLSYSGAVEAWDRDAETGEFVSTPVGPRLALPTGGEDDDAHHPRRRKYIAAAPDGRLVAVLKDSRAFTVEERGWRSGQQHGPTFEVWVLDVARGRWEEAADIGDLALFVGVNASMCVLAREHPGIRAGCVYYAEDELGRASLRLEGERPHGTSSNACPSSMDDDDYELRDLGVYVLMHRRAEKVVQGIGRHCSWPLPAWFTPSVM
ncbi:unnamed protein product [Urochloa decumbens]|uniref:KIB1-4 beta-propeller domain-containing protein n=1 Tax=Urochloa decumbens TaxID=240449 RepID=A0ABC9BRU5_9POAL